MSSKSMRVLALHGDGDQILLQVASSPLGPFQIDWSPSLQALSACLATENVDAAILSVAQAEALGGLLERGALNAAMLLLADAGAADVPAAELTRWLQLGVQEVLTPAECLDGGLARRLRAAIARHALAGELRRAYATDLGTGLPHEQQLIEHMSHLMALREREPAPMAVLVLRIEGLATAESRFGAQAAAVLRRKLAVRLRAGVRASDVVAALDSQSFGVLLASVSSPDQAARVGRKLLMSLRAPFKVGGHDLAVATALGIGQYPRDGTQPSALLHHAISLAAVAPAEGRAGFANFTESPPPDAANE
jgi:GGDEF domain-containing protein